MQRLTETEAKALLKDYKVVLNDLSIEIITQADLVKDTAETIIDLEKKLISQKSELKFLENQHRMRNKIIRKLEKKYNKDKAAKAVPSFS